MTRPIYAVERTP